MEYLHTEFVKTWNTAAKNQKLRYFLWLPTALTPFTMKMILSRHAEDVFFFWQNPAFTLFTKILGGSTGFKLKFLRFPTIIQSFIPISILDFENVTMLTLLIKFHYVRLTLMGLCISFLWWLCHIEFLFSNNNFA